MWKWKQIFGKQMFATSHAEIKGPEKDFEQADLAKSPPVYHTSLVFFVVISGDSSLPETGPLSKLFQSVKGEVKALPEPFVSQK